MTQPRIVVLTGATRGLGRAMLKELVAAGHTVAGCGRNADHIESLRRVVSGTAPLRNLGRE